MTAGRARPGPRGDRGRIPLRAGVAAGALAGSTVGLLFGGIGGAFLVWLSGAVLEWQRSLGFTLGVAQTLLPFGDQAETLRWLGDSWLIVIPAAAAVVGAITALLGAIVGGIVTVAYNLATGWAGVVTEADGSSTDRDG